IDPTHMHGATLDGLVWSDYRQEARRLGILPPENPNEPDIPPLLGDLSALGPVEPPSAPTIDRDPSSGPGIRPGRRPIQPAPPPSGIRRAPNTSIRRVPPPGIRRVPPPQQT